MKARVLPGEKTKWLNSSIPRQHSPAYSAGRHGDDKLHKDVLFSVAVRAILLHWLFVFICIVWILLCGNYGDVIFMLRLEEKAHRVKKALLADVDSLHVNV